MEMFANILFVGALLSFIMMIISAFTLKAAFFLKNPTKQKGILAWAGIALVCAFLVSIFVPDKTTVLPGTPLAYTVVNQEIDTSATPGRERLYVTIVPSGDQTSATQGDLISTVMAVAMEYQKATDAPLVRVNMLSQVASNAYGELSLATAIYIPDGKGYSGKQDIGPWDMVMGAERGFTKDELIYLQNWAAMRGNFMNSDGLVMDDALDAAISERMGIPKGSLKPHFNSMGKLSEE